MSNPFNIHKPGDYLMQDQLSGLWVWASEMATDWDGTYRAPINLDGEHPQIRPRTYPRESFPSRVAPDTTPVSANTTTTEPTTYGQTSIPVVRGPASFLFD